MNNNLIHSKLKISFDNDFISRHFNVTPAQAKLVKELAIRVHSKIDKVLIRKLEKLSKENPNLPQLKNYLSVAYNKMGDFSKSLEINRQLLEEFPDYLHARLNAANHYIYIGEPNEALLYLGKNLDLKELFPSRDEFHFSEVQAYYYSTVLYALAKKDLPLAENRLELYRSIDEENPRIEDLEDQVTHLRIYLEFENEDESYYDFSELIENDPPVTDRINPPVFHHQQIDQLYQIGFKNAKPLFDEILSLPRETVIQDLEMVLQDGIERFPYFLEKEWSVFTHSFALHAIFLLMELKATDSLMPVLNFLQYDEEFLEFYIGDFLTEEIWQCVYFLGKDQLGLLKEYLMKPGVSTFAKSAVSQAIVQISILEVDRSKEVEQAYTEIVSFFINAKAECNVIDATFLGLMAGDIGNLNLKSLYPLIERLYDLDYIDLSIEGDFEEFLLNHNHDTIMSPEYSIVALSEIYSNAEFCEESDVVNNEKYTYFNSRENEPKVIQLPLRTVKVNRNDPCPCGSGKKYKKCCG
jgi:tetratricopeptide (TPR) repeat protein